jgi:hypothetical protein
MGSCGNGKVGEKNQSFFSVTSGSVGNFLPQAFCNCTTGKQLWVVAFPTAADLWLGF